MGKLLYHPIPAALVLLALLVVASSCGTSSGGEAGRAEQPGEDSEASGNPTLGAADAPVEMIEWGDFR